MTKRGRKPHGTLPLLEPVKRRFPNPPPGMSNNARTVFHRIVRSFEPDHFRPYQYDLLRVYSESSATYKKAMLEVHKNGAVITQLNGVTKISPWVDVAMKASATMISMSVKLGLTMNATLVNRGKASKAPEPKSRRDGLLFGGKKDD